MSTERLWLALGAVLAIALGLFIPHIGSTGALAVALVVPVVLIAWWIWWLLKRVRRYEGLPVRPSVDDGRYVVGRTLLYAGLLTSCWLQLRVVGVTISDALFLSALAWTIAEYALSDRGHLRVLPDGVWVGVGLFVLGGTISTIANSSDKTSSAGLILRVLYLVVAWFWLGGTTLRGTNHIWTALKFWVVSAAVCGAWALGQKYGHLPGNLDGNRFAGLADHVNDLGALTACALVPALAIAYRDRRWIVAVLGIAVGLTLSASIGAGLAALIALSFGVLSRDLSRAVMVALAVGAIGLVLASPLIGGSAIARFATATNSNALYGQDTFYTRLRTYHAAWERIKSDPFIGTGLDLKSSEVLDKQNETYYQVHNLFLGRWYDSGILGLLGMLTLVGTLGKLGWQLIGRSPDRYLALALFSAFVAYVGDEMSEPSLYKRYSLVPALLMIALRATMLRNEPEKQAEDRFSESERELVVA